MILVMLIPPIPVRAFVLPGGVDIGANLRNYSVTQPFGCCRSLTLTGTFCIACVWRRDAAAAVTIKLAATRMATAEFKMI
jgi:hypothetical protein